MSTFAWMLLQVASMSEVSFLRKKGGMERLLKKLSIKAGWRENCDDALIIEGRDRAGSCFTPGMCQNETLNVATRALFDPFPHLNVTSSNSDTSTINLSTHDCLFEFKVFFLVLLMYYVSQRRPTSQRKFGVPISQLLMRPPPKLFVTYFYVKTLVFYIEVRLYSSFYQYLLWPQVLATRQHGT